MAEEQVEQASVQEEEEPENDAAALASKGADHCKCVECEDTHSVIYTSSIYNVIWCPSRLPFNRNRLEENPSCLKSSPPHGGLGNVYSSKALQTDAAYSSSMSVQVCLSGAVAHTAVAWPGSAQEKGDPLLLP